ncbi:dienelactone hydrolase [Sporomusaceae bacterium BoRhaA]|uniref:alpha/beta hydrolase family protein n=1 Tax=Pelorhabdus rhamnosifermentans TaxID=2772457 RepID=UPI001C064687|nr:alpha/beta hydrolase [Pelorhabdus rhamnosifermentans]MBU2700429.1 dienelactone hydrolase [Pelorhabdus rhamnosifermentans]
MKKFFFIIIFIIIILSFTNQQISLANEKEPYTIESTICNYKSEVNGIEKSICIEHIMFNANINNQNHLLEAVIYRPMDDKQHQVMIFTHGRKGPNPPKNPRQYLAYNNICKYFAGEDLVVMYVVRRGFGNSEGSIMDEYKDTPLSSGLEMVKDLSAAIDYIKTKDYVLKDKYVIAGHSQGGWAALSSSTVKIDGVACVINFSGATNYAKAPRISNWQPVVNRNLTETCKILGKSNKVPTLWIYGTDEPNRTPDQTKEMFDTFVSSGGNGNLIILPGIDHDTTNSSAIKLWQVEVRKFLEKNSIVNLQNNSVLPSHNKLVA